VKLRFPGTEVPPDINEVLFFILNKTSMNTNGYGELFVKWRGLFCVMLASRRDVD
jgi:hypothetical protein